MFILNSNLSALKANELFDYEFSGGDVHVYKCGRIIQYHIHVHNISVAAYAERQVYALNSEKWFPWVNLIKVPAVCDNPGDGDFYFTITDAGRILLGTRNKAITASEGLHFYGWVCGISKN